MLEEELMARVRAADPALSVQLPIQEILDLLHKKMAENQALREENHQLRATMSQNTLPPVAEAEIDGGTALRDTSMLEPRKDRHLPEGAQSMSALSSLPSEQPSDSFMSSSPEPQSELDHQTTPTSTPPHPRRAAKRLKLDDSDSDQSEDYYMDTESDEELDTSSLIPPLTEQARRAQHETARGLSVDLPEDEIVRRVLEIVFPEGSPSAENIKPSYRFDVQAAVRMTVRKLKSAREGRAWRRFNVSEEGDLPEIIAGGVTQNGKTKIKVLAIITAGLLGVGTILLSTTHRGVESLTKKIDKELTQLVDKKLGICCIPLTSIHKPEAHAGVVIKFLESGCCTVPDTAHRIKQMYSILRQTRPADNPCQLIMDEADAFYRNRKNPIRLEQALSCLCRTAHLVLRWNVSATLVPVFLHLQDKRGGLDTDSILYTKPEGDYIGVEDFKPLCIDGEDQFLDYGDLKPSNLYSNELTDKLYQQAFSKDKSLTLVIANSRVNAVNNVHDLAKSLRRRFPHIAALVVVGGSQGLTYYPPVAPRAPTNGRAPSKEDLNPKPQLSVSKAIEMIDKHVGIDTPLVIVGYSQMIRGDSFRSPLRVPTHILCALGTAMSIEKMVQAMGRATYQNSTLQTNGFSHVSVLTYPTDFDTAQAYPRWLMEMQSKLRDGMTLTEALSSSTMYTDRANFTFRQRKSIGQKKDCLSLEVCYSLPQRGQERPGRLWLDKRVRTNPVASKLIDLAKKHAESWESFVHEELRKDEFTVGLTAQEYCDEWNSTWTAEAVTLQYVTSGLTKLVTNGIMRKSDGKRARYWLPSEEL
eukprot:754455-Hanusia_phi.AAC.6